MRRPSRTCEGQLWGVVETTTPPEHQSPRSGANEPIGHRGTGVARELDCFVLVAHHDPERLTRDGDPLLLRIERDVRFFERNLDRAIISWLSARANLPAGMITTCWPARPTTVLPAKIDATAKPVTNEMSLLGGSAMNHHSI